jgi:hypothetical protein
MKNKIRWLTRTAVLVALLITVQWATAGTQAFAGQYITGSLVNAVLAVAALLCGLSTGLVVAVLSPFFAFALGIGPKLLPIVPMIALGNCVYVLALSLLTGKAARKWQQIAGVAAAAVAKFLTLYLAVVQILIPILGESFLELVGGEFSASSVGALPLVLGFLSAFVSGLFACKVMIALVKKAKLSWFAIYCLIAAAAIFIFA